MLYTGYVGLAVPFACAIAALMEGKLDEIRRKVGGRRTLDGLVRYVAEVEREKRDIAKRKQERMRRGEENLNETVPPPDPYRYNVAHLAEGGSCLLRFGQM